MQENKSLKNKFENFSSKPDAEVWQRIEAELDKKPKRRAFLWWWAAAAMLVFTSLTVFYFNAHQNENLTSNTSEDSTRSLSDLETKRTAPAELQSQEHVANPSKTLSSAETGRSQKDYKPASQALSKQKHANAVQASETLSASAQEHKTGTLRNKNNSRRTSKPLPLEHDSDSLKTLITSLPAQAAKKRANPNHHDANQVQKDSISHNLLSEKVEDTIIHYCEKMKISPLSKWSLTLHSSAHTTSTINENFLTPSSPSSEFYSGLNNISQMGWSPYRQIISGFGLDAAYALNPKWQLRSGLNYWTYRTFFINSNEWQRGANYIQLALGADYLIMKKNRFSWQIGSGLGTGLITNSSAASSQSHWRTEMNLNTALSYQLNSKLFIRLQPTSRLVIGDSQLGQFGKLSRWFHGCNLGVGYQF